jgi:hypothetical protein
VADYQQRVARVQAGADPVDNLFDPANHSGFSLRTDLWGRQRRAPGIYTSRSPGRP